MAEYKLLVLDIDGTLLSSRYHLPRRTAMAVRRAALRGYLVTLATGRPYRSALPVAKALGLTLPLVTADGAYGVDPVSHQPIWSEPISAELALAAVRLLEAHGLAIYLQLPDGALGNERLGIRLSHLFKTHPKAYPLALATLRSYPRRVRRRLALALEADPIAPPKIWVRGQPAQIEAARQAIGQQLGGQLHFTPSGDITAQGVTKASGLRRLTTHLGIDPGQVIAVGDQFNDYEMLGFAGLGIAMGNAPAEVKGQARYVTGTSDEYGVAQVIEQFLFRG